MQNTHEGEYAECPINLTNYDVAKNLVKSLLHMKLDY